MEGSPPTDLMEKFQKKKKKKDGHGDQILEQSVLFLMGSNGLS